MKTQVLIALTFCSAASVATAVTPTHCMAQIKTDLEFRIASDKPSYILGEPIKITSTVTNRGLNAVKVKEPSGLSIVSAFTLQYGEGEKKQIFQHLAGFGTPIYRTVIVDLAAEQSVSNSCELGMQIMRSLEVGKYTLRAKYYQTKFEGQDYIEAKPIEFEIVEPSPPVKPLWNELSVALQTTDNEQKKALLQAFLKAHPVSVYRPVVLEELFYLKYGAKEFAAAVEMGRQLLKEPVSDSKRELAMFFIAKAMDEAGDTKSAIESLKNATLPNSYLLRKELEQKLKQAEK